MQRAPSQHRALDHISAHDHFTMQRRVKIIDTPF
jgi:hypothetical protein